MVLVSIVGNFYSSILPVFYQMKDQIDIHILVYDEFYIDKNNTKDIYQGIENIKKKYKLKFKNIEYKIKENSKYSVENLSEKIHKHTSSYEKLYINTTDGLATINTLLSLEFISKGANILAYDRYKNEVNFITKQEVKSYKLDQVIPIKDHFMLKNLTAEYSLNKNLFDVLFTKDNHLHMIECIMAYADINGLIYKYLALKELLDDGDDDSKMAILSRHDDYLRKVLSKCPDDEDTIKQRAVLSDMLLRGLVYGNENKFKKDMKKVFLLGGYDLEMLEIKKILDKHSIKYEDKGLSCGAKLSEYKDEFEKYKNYKIYGIELEEDITLPKNYKEIDHHNENSNKPSSIEQVVNLLDIELSRKQMLIAKNDSAFINGMISICATEDEINDIRQKDRESQGITHNDEDLAVQSIDKAEDKNIIYSYTSHFTAISDKVYNKFDKYIIYNDYKVIFYGYEIKKIKKLLNNKKIDENSYNYGGGDFGFLGIKDDILDKDKIENLINELISKQDEIYSYHIFMLPFTFKNKFNNNSKKWIYKEFKLEEQRNYNEYVYFYKHVQDAIYNKEQQEKWISKYYEYENQNGIYTIDCKIGKFDLEIDGLSLRIFNTDVAILSLNLKNTKYPKSKDVLAINDFGRRIYPQFLGEKFVSDTKQAILANSLTMHLENEEPIEENFKQFNTIDKINENFSLLPKFIKHLIGNDFTDQIRPIIDDRMFVISQYHNDVLVEKLKVYKECNEYEYEQNDFWYKYLFVDGKEKSSQSKHMTKKFIGISSYDRWIEWGTLFGISRYSFVSITGSWFGKNRLLPHTQTMYFQMFTLLLAYRATIIKFSDDIQDTTGANKEKISAETQELYKKYLNFLNKLYFKEITAQDQGIELYNQAIKLMNIEKYMSDLDNEINELHNYVKIIEETNRNKTLDKISYFGAVLLPPSLLTSFFGMNILNLDNTLWNETLGLFFIMLSGVIGFSFVYKDDNVKHKTFLSKFLNGFKKFKIDILCIFIFIFFIFEQSNDKKELNGVIVSQEPNVIIKDIKKETHE